MHFLESVPRNYQKIASRKWMSYLQICRLKPNLTSAYRENLQYVLNLSRNTRKIALRAVVYLGNNYKIAVRTVVELEQVTSFALYSLLALGQECSKPSIWYKFIFSSASVLSLKRQKQWRNFQRSEPELDGIIITNNSWNIEFCLVWACCRWCSYFSYSLINKQKILRQLHRFYSNRKLGNTCCELVSEFGNISKLQISSKVWHVRSFC